MDDHLLHVAVLITADSEICPCQIGCMGCSDQTEISLPIDVEYRVAQLCLRNVAARNAGISLRSAISKRLAHYVADVECVESCV